MRRLAKALLKASELLATIAVVLDSTEQRSETIPNEPGADPVNALRLLNAGGRIQMAGLELHHELFPTEEITTRVEA